MCEKNAKKQGFYAILSLRELFFKPRKNDGPDSSGGGRIPDTEKPFFK
jgi:hypothetical protein